MNSPGYSARYGGQAAAPQASEPVVDTERIRRERELSLETNRRRKLLAERKQQLLLLEQERINAAVAQRKENVRQATARYQHVRSASATRHEPRSAAPGDSSRATPTDSDRSASRAEIVRYIQQNSHRSVPDAQPSDTRFFPSGRNTFRVDNVALANGSLLRRSSSVDGLHDEFNRRAEPLDGKRVAVQLTNNHVVMSKYGVLPADSQAAPSAKREADLRQDTHRVLDQRPAPDTVYRAFQEKSRVLEHELSRFTRPEQRLLADSLESDPPDTRWAAPASRIPRPVDPPAALRPEREQPVLLQLRRRGSVTDMHQDSEVPPPPSDQLALASGPPIRGILKNNMRRSASLDNIARYAQLSQDSLSDQKARDIRDSVEVTNFRHLPIPVNVNPKAPTLEDSLNSKKSVRFSEKNSETLIDNEQALVDVEPAELPAFEHDARRTHPQVFRMSSASLGERAQVPLDSPPKVALQVIDSAGKPPTGSASAKRTSSSAAGAKPPLHPNGLPANAARPPLPSRQQPQPTRLDDAPVMSGVRHDNSIYDGIDFNSVRTPTDAEINALWATVRDYLRHSPSTTPTPRAASLASSSSLTNRTGSTFNAAQNMVGRTQGVVDGTMLGLAGPQVRAMRTMNASGSKPTPLRSPTAAAAAAASQQAVSGLSSGQTSPHIWPSLMHTGNSVRRKPPAAANRSKPRKVNEDALLQLAKQMALQKQKHDPCEANDNDNNVSDSLQHFLHAEQLAARDSVSVDSVHSFVSHEPPPQSSRSTAPSSVRSAASAPPTVHNGVKQVPSPKLALRDAGLACRPANPQNAPASTLSIEERRIMQSIARLDQHLRNFK